MHEEELTGKVCWLPGPPPPPILTSAFKEGSVLEGLD